MFEAHFGVAMAGAVLNTLNTRLDVSTIAYILDHADTKILITDAAFGATMKEALEQSPNKSLAIIDIVDSQDSDSANGRRLGEIEYEAFNAGGDSDYVWQMPADEWSAMALNYLWHKRPSKGRGVSSSRRLSDGDGHYSCLEYAHASNLSICGADVPL